MTPASTLNPTSQSESTPSPGNKSSQPSLRVVAIGGGTGLSTLLRGLKRFVATPSAMRRSTDVRPRLRSDRSPERTPAPPASSRPPYLPERRAQHIGPDLPCLICDLAAVVTVTDDGGSSGPLRADLTILPPAAIRNCMVALSEIGRAHV